MHNECQQEVRSRRVDQRPGVHDRPSSSVSEGCQRWGWGEVCNFVRCSHTAHVPSAHAHTHTIALLLQLQIINIFTHQFTNVFFRHYTLLVKIYKFCSLLGTSSWKLQVVVVQNSIQYILDLSPVEDNARLSHVPVSSNQFRCRTSSTQHCTATYRHLHAVDGISSSCINMISLHERYIHQVLHFIVNLQCFIHNVNTDRILHITQNCSHQRHCTDFTDSRLFNGFMLFNDFQLTR